MKKFNILLSAACALLLMQSCSKNEAFTKKDQLKSNKKRVMADEVTDVTLASTYYKFVTWEYLERWQQQSNAPHRRHECCRRCTG